METQLVTTHPRRHIQSAFRFRLQLIHKESKWTPIMDLSTDKKRPLYSCLQCVWACVCVCAIVDRKEWGRWWWWSDLMWLMVSFLGLRGRWTSQYAPALSPGAWISSILRPGQSVSVRFPGWTYWFLRKAEMISWLINYLTNLQPFLGVNAAFLHALRSCDDRKTVITFISSHFKQNIELK